MLRQKLSADAMYRFFVQNEKCNVASKIVCRRQKLSADINVALKIVLKNRRVKHRLKISNDDHWQLTWLSLNAEI